MKTSQIGILLTLVGIFTSCSDDEKTPDLVGESVGDYRYTVKVFRGVNTAAEIITGDLVLSRSGDDLTIVIDKIESIHSSGVDLFSKGYGFNIEAATIKDDGGYLVNRIGNTTVTLNGKSYHGRYEVGPKELRFNASYDYQDPQFAKYNFSAEVITYKKNR